jgi:serine/threonine-protein kinase
MRFCPRCGTRFAAGEPRCPRDGSATQELPGETPSDPLVGTIVDGRYRIERKIGEGGMGVVYRAVHTALGKKLALKVLRGEMAQDVAVVQRFVNEARAASAIGHENIIDIFDFGRLADGSAYFVMEYLEGEPLTAFVRRGGSVPVRDVVHVLRQIASALAAAHARGIVHRDLKPDNIFLVKREGRPLFVKVLDFGIAKVGGASSKLTKTGMVFGTPHYMSPEQAAGQAVDHRADIYSLGVIMYEMLVGRVPFDADSVMGILTKHMFEPPVPPSQALGAGGARLGALEDITLRALQKKPEHRYSTMGELLDALDRVAPGGNVFEDTRGAVAPPDRLADVLEPPSRTEMRLSGPVSPGAVGVETHVPEPAARRRLPVRTGVGAAAAVVLLGVGLTGAYVFVTSGRTPQAREVRIANGASSGVSALLVQGTSGGGRPGGASVTSVGVSTSGARVGDARSVGATVADSGPSGPTAVEPPSHEVGPAGASGEDAGADSAAVAQVVRLESSPDGAEVYLAGAFLGNTPIDVPRPTSGERVVELRLVGHQAQTVLLSGQSPAKMTVKLLRASPGATAPHGGRPSGARGQGDLFTQPLGILDPWQSR